MKTINYASVSITDNGGTLGHVRFTNAADADAFNHLQRGAYQVRMEPVVVVESVEEAMEYRKKLLTESALKRLSPAEREAMGFKP